MKHNDFRKDLERIHADWESLQGNEAFQDDLPKLKQIARDLLKLEQDAKALMEQAEKADEVHHLLTTPWGAPFVGEMTLLEAAKAFNGTPDSPLFHLLRDFATFGPKFHSQIFDIFEEIHEDLDP